MLPVLYLNPAGYIGGAEKSLIDLVIHLPPDRFRALVVLLSPGPLKQGLQKRGIDCEEMALPASLLRLSRRKRNSFLAFFNLPFLTFPVVMRLLGLIRSRNIAIIHTNGIKAHLLGCILSFLTGKVLIWHFRDLLAEGVYLRIFRILARLFPKRIIANSSKVKESLGNLKKVSVVYNGVDLNLFSSPADITSIRKEWGLKPNDLAIGTVGHFAPLKGYEDFVHAMPRVLDNVPRARFFIVGEAIYPAYRDYKQRVRNLVERMGLSGKVIFPGSRDDLPVIMEALDIFVLPSWSEGFGRGNLEAMAAGRPIVSTNVGGIPEVVADGGNGILVPPHDPERLAEAIIRLARDGRLREKMGQAGRKRAEHFSVEKMVAGVVSVYEEVLRVAG